MSKHVEMRRLPRFFIAGRAASFGSARSAYKALAKRIIASEFDHLGWHSDVEGIASPALVAFRKKWMTFDLAGEGWGLKREYREELKRIIAELEAADAAVALEGKVK